MSQKFEKTYWNFVDRKFKNSYNFADLLPVLTIYVDRIKRHFVGKIRILDIGCGFGYFLNFCDKLNWETYGVDISSHAINIARKNTKAQLYLHDIQNTEKSPFRENFFDLVTIFDVLEHLDFPAVALEEVYRNLKHSGKLLIITPNLNAVERMILKILLREKVWHGFNDETHVNLFTPFSLNALVKGIGFEVIELKTPFHSLPIAASKILEKTGLGGRILLLAEKV